MSSQNSPASQKFIKALDIGRPPNIKRLFPHSRALIVSGKAIDRALLVKGKAMTIAANGRNQLVIRGALTAAQRANAAIIIEIAKSEGGSTAYCAVNYWNVARQVDAIANELGVVTALAYYPKWKRLFNIRHPWVLELGICMGYPVGEPNGFVHRDTQYTDWFDDDGHKVVF